MLRRTLPTFARPLKFAPVGENKKMLGLNKNQLKKLRKKPGAQFWLHDKSKDNAKVTINVIDDVGSTSNIINTRQLKQQQQQGEVYDDDDEGENYFDETTTAPHQGAAEPFVDDDGGENGDFYLDHTNFNKSNSSSSSSPRMSRDEERQKLLELNRGGSLATTTQQTRRNQFNTLSGFNSNSLYDDQRYQQQQQQEDYHSLANNNNSNELDQNYNNESGSLEDLSKYNLKLGKDTAISLRTDPQTIDTEEDMAYKDITRGAFDIKTRRSQTVIPAHLNDLYSKISRWTNELKEQPATSPSPSSKRPGTMVDVLDDNEDNFAIDNRTGTLDNPSPEAVKANPLLAQHAMNRAKEKLQYGALMDAFESDRFATENKIAVAGAKFEKGFTQWQGVKILENVPQQQMEDTRQSKGSLIMHNPRSFKIPRMNHDHCTGCGACLQDQKESEFGYCYPGDIEQYVLCHQAVFSARQDYATRMYELMSHWEKHGKRVGEEWLDFMTQEEFNAVYRFVSRPFVCRRCVSLENYGVTTANMVMSPPDFKEKLTALREKKCVVVLVIDITDFPGSMVPDLPGLISMNNPVIIVANKLDCINAVSYEYKGKNAEKVKTRIGAGYLKKWVMDQAVQFRLPASQIKAVVPVSSKKGWGIPELVEQIEKFSNLNFTKPTPPVPTYFVGVSNAGKSSVINAIAHHLYQPEAPLPTSKKVYYSYTDSKTGEEKINWKWVTDKKLYSGEMDMVKARFNKLNTKLMTTSALPGTTINAVAIKLSLTGSGAQHTEQEGNNDVSRNSNKNKNNNKHYSGYGDRKHNHTFFFDTPGLHPVWQETSPLTIKDQVKNLMRTRRNPFGRLLTQGHTLFLGGVACIDVVKASCDIFFMSYHTEHVTTAHCETEQSEIFWRENVGMKLTPPHSRATLVDNDDGDSDRIVPAGDLSSDSTTARINTSLCVKRSYLFECYENHFRKPKADIYFCGIGWVSFCTSRPADIVLRVRTLPGIVHGVRQPLRRRDLNRFSGWPKLPPAMKSTSKAKNNRINDVIELVDGPSDVDLSRPPLLEVKKTTPLTSSLGLDKEVRAKNRREKYYDVGDEQEEGKSSVKKKRHDNYTTTDRKEQDEEREIRKLIKEESNAAPFDFIMQQLNKQGKVGNSK